MLMESTCQKKFTRLTRFAPPPICSSNSDVSATVHNTFKNTTEDSEEVSYNTKDFINNLNKEEAHAKAEEAEKMVADPEKRDTDTDYSFNGYC